MTCTGEGRGQIEFAEIQVLKYLNQWGKAGMPRAREKLGYNAKEGGGSVGERIGNWIWDWKKQRSGKVSTWYQRSSPSLTAGIYINITTIH